MRDVDNESTHADHGFAMHPFHMDGQLNPAILAAVEGKARLQCHVPVFERYGAQVDDLHGFECDIQQGMVLPARERVAE